MKILFDSRLSAEEIGCFPDEQKHVWNADYWFSEERLRRTIRRTQIDGKYVHFGDPNKLIILHGFTHFISKDMKMSDVLNFCQLLEPEESEYPEFTSNYAAENDNRQRVSLERWKTQPDETKNGESCPICLSLEDMGWVERGAPVTYRWSSGEKTIMGLPDYRRAHSSIGSGNWKVGDQFCKCYKQFKTGFKTQEFSATKVVYIDITSHENCKH